MINVTYVGGDVAGGNVATLTGLSWASAGSFSAGDVALLFWSGSSAVTWTDPTGWGTPVLSVDGGNSHRFRMYKRVVDGTETGDVSLVHSAANLQSAVLEIYRGVDQSNPVNASATFDETLAQTTHQPPAVTTNAVGCAILTAISERQTSGTNDWSIPGDFVERHDTTTLAAGSSGTITAVADDRGFIPTGPQAVAAGASSTPDYLVTTNADAEDIPIGAQVQLFTSADALKETTLFTVYDRPSAFGFTNLTFTPNAAANAATGDKMKIVANNTGRAIGTWTPPIWTSVNAIAVANVIVFTVALKPAVENVVTDSFTASEFALVETSNVQWRVAVDWDGESLVPDVFTGAEATAFNDAATPGLLTATDGDANDIGIGDTVQLFNSADEMKEPGYFQVYRKASAFGFTNILFRPAAQELPVTGDKLKVVITGGFNQEHDDVTDRTLAESELVVEFGRDQVRALSPAASGRATFSLNNLSLDYSPDNPDSAIAGKVLPARPVIVQAKLDGVDYTLFRGFYDDFDVKPNKFRSSVDVQALDPVAAMKESKISTPLLKGVRSGDAVHAVLDAMGWPEDRRVIDTGVSCFQWFWATEQDGFQVLQDIANSEGPGAVIYADQYGKIVFEDRHHRFFSTRSNTSQATFGPDSTDEPAYSELIYDHGWRDIVNSVTVQVREFALSGEQVTVWEDASVRSIPAGTTLSVIVEPDNPVVDSALRFDLLTGSGFFWIDELGAQKLQFNIQATTAMAVNNISVVAYELTEARTFQVSTEDSGSQAKYKKRDYPYEAPWANQHDALAIGQLIVGKYSERTPIVTAVFRSGTQQSSTRLLEQLSRDLSDRVHLTNDETMLDHDFHIETIKHRVSEAGLKLETEFGMERAIAFPDNVFRFDDADRGFDQGVFGQSGITDFKALFIFDQAGHGFNDGCFAI